MRKLLELLLSKFAAADYTIEEKGSNLIIKTKDASIAEKIRVHLQVSLRSTSEFYANFPIEIKTENLDALPKLTITAAEPVPLPDNTIESVERVFENIFGPAFEDAGFDPALFFGEGAKIKDGVLFSKPAKSVGIEKTWRSLFDWLSLYFKDVDLGALREAWTGKKSLPAPTEESFESLKTSHIHGLVQQCFGIQKIGKTTVGYFNFKRLYEFIFAPTLAVSNEDNAYSIQIDKNHFLTYVEQLKENGVLLRIFKPNEDQQPVIQPLFIGLKETVESQPLYVLVIDKSGSLGWHFDSLKRHVQSFIDELRQIKPNAKLRITFFNSEIDPGKEFDIQDAAAISTFLANTLTGGTTNLFGALNREIQYANSQASTHAVAVMLFTDGVDNVNDDTKKQSLSESLKKEAGKSEAPNFYAYGYGDYDQETLSKLAVTLQGSFVHLQSFEQLDNAFNLASSKKESRILVNLKSLLNSGESTTYRVPLYADGTLQSPDIFIPLTDSSMKLEIQGKSIVVTVPDNAAIPAATNLDKISLLVAKSRQLVADEMLTVAEKIKNLDNFLTQLKMLPAQTSDEKEVKGWVEDELQDYRSTISTAKDDATLKSIYTKARIRTHFVESVNNGELVAKCSAVGGNSDCSKTSNSGPVYTNGVELVQPLASQLQTEIVDAISKRGNSAAQQAIPFKFIRSAYAVVGSVASTFSSTTKNSRAVEVVSPLPNDQESSGKPVSQSAMVSPPPPTDFNSQLMLFAVGFNIAKKTVEWVGNWFSEKPIETVVPCAQALDELAKFSIQIKMIRDRLARQPKIVQTHFEWVNDRLENFREDIRKLSSQSEVSAFELEELKNDISSLRAEFADDLKRTKNPDALCSIEGFGNYASVFVQDKSVTDVANLMISAGNQTINSPIVAPKNSLVNMKQ